MSLHGQLNARRLQSLAGHVDPWFAAQPDQEGVSDSRLARATKIALADEGGEKLVSLLELLRLLDQPPEASRMIAERSTVPERAVRGSVRADEKCPDCGRYQHPRRVVWVRVGCAFGECDGRGCIGCLWRRTALRFYAA